MDRFIDLIWSFLHKPRYVTNVNEVDDGGVTARVAAQEAGHVAVAALLQKNGAV